MSSTRVVPEGKNFGGWVDEYYDAIASNPPDIYMEVSFPKGISALMEQGKLAV